MKRFGHNRALNGVTFQVPRGTVFGVIGPNGAGKTTIMRALLDIIRPSSGQATVLGTPSRNAGPELRRRIGYLPLLTASVALLGGALTGRRIGGIAGGATVAGLGYVFNALGNQSTSLDWLHNLSPYYWAFGDSPLSTGANVTTIVVFYAVSLMLAAAAAIALRQRDIGV